MSQLPPHDAEQDARLTRGRRKFTVILLLALLATWVLPQGLLWIAKRDVFGPQDSPQQIFQKVHNKKQLLSVVRHWPGYANAAKRADSRILSHAMYRLRPARNSTSRTSARRLRFQQYLSLAWVRSSPRYLQQVCRQQRPQLLARLLYPGLDLVRFAHTDLGALASLQAMQQGNQARLGWLSQQKLASPRLNSKGLLRYVHEKEAWLLLMAGLWKPALEVLERGLKHPRARLGSRLRMALARCSVRAALGLPSKGPGSPLCLASRSWWTLQQGRALQALALLPSTPRRVSASHPLFLARAAALAALRRWDELEALWRQVQPHTRPTADVFALFNDLYTRTIPPRLLAGLEAALEAQQLSPNPRPGLVRLLQWLRLTRAQQWLLLGHPRRSKARHRSLNTAQARHSYASLLELLEGPAQALKALKASASPPPLLRATYLLRTGAHAKAALLLKGTSCYKNGVGHVRLCLLLRTLLALETRDRQAMQKAQKALQSPKYNPFGDELSHVLWSRHFKRRHRPLHRVLRYPPLSDAEKHMRAYMLFMEQLDPTGALSRRTLPRWSCERPSLSPDGHLLLTYLLEGLAKRHKRPASATLARRRKQLGLMYHRLAALWLPLAGL